MIQSLYANATTLATNMDGVKNGHVGLITKDTLYTTLATGTPWEYPYDPGAIPTIAKNSTVAHHQQAHEIYGKARRFLENATTIDEALKHKIFETIEDTYITELCKKNTGFMVFKTIDMVHHLMDINGEMYRNLPQGEPEEIR